MNARKLSLNCNYYMNRGNSAELPATGYRLPAAIPLAPRAPVAYTRNHMVTISRDERLDRIFSGLADPTRRAILARLMRGEATVGELAEPFDMSRPAISKHLDVLERAGLVHCTPEGRVNRCSFDGKPLRTAQAWLDLYRRYWETQLDALKHYLEKEEDR